MHEEIDNQPSWLPGLELPELQPANPEAADRSEPPPPPPPSAERSPEAPSHANGAAPSSQCLLPEEDPNQPVSSGQPDPPENSASLPEDAPFEDNSGPASVYWDDAPETAAVCELDDWKDSLRGDFESWLETVDEIPDSDAGEAEEAEQDAPDLLAFYSQLAAANAEARKANRRTAETFSQWSDTLTRFEEDLRLLRGQLIRLNETAAQDQSVPRDFCLALVDLQDRLGRIGRAFRQSPARSWWHNDRSWRQSWETQRKGFEILNGHTEVLLERAGLTRFNTVGQPFDPTRMVAAATETNPSRPHQVVLEELLPGYLRNSEVLRPAQVKVSIHPQSSP